MRKLLFTILAALSFCYISGQTVIYRDPRTVTIEYPSTRRVYRSNTRAYQEKPQSGCIGLQAHCDYNFTNIEMTYIDTRENEILYKYPCIEFGGAIFYNFGHKAKGNFGLLVGFDYGMMQWWRHKDNGVINDNVFWDIRAGVNISKYFGIGMTVGQYNYKGSWKDDFGVYLNLNLPCTTWFGIMIDGKWTSYQGFSVGGGLFFKINTKY